VQAKIVHVIRCLAKLRVFDRLHDIIRHFLPKGEQLDLHKMTFFGQLKVKYSYD